MTAAEKDRRDRTRNLLDELLAVRKENVAQAARIRDLEVALVPDPAVGPLGISPCLDCGEPWPHPSVLSIRARCQSCQRKLVDRIRDLEADLSEAQYAIEQGANTLRLAQDHSRTLEAALGPFADMADDFAGFPEEHFLLVGKEKDISVTVGDLRRAAEGLRPVEGLKEEGRE